jgi:geranylgeranyl reductase family protein
MSFDAAVIVAGAGPAGSVAARTLSAAGIDALLVERGQFPRNKPCGGGITTRGLTRFPWLRQAIDGIDIHSVAKLHLEAPDGSVLKLSAEDPVGILIRRVEFDHALVKSAVQSGARLREGFEITQVERAADGITLRSRTGETLRAPMVVAADGVHSVIAKRLGVNARWPTRSIAIDMMEETPHATLRAARPDEVWIAYAYRGLDGYSYIFPKTNHVNVGIGCLLSHFKGEVAARPYDLQSGFVSALVASGELQGRSDRRHFTPYLIPVGGPLPKTYDQGGRVLFAGDAGGFVNGFTAEGIYYSMMSGELAAQAIVSAGARPERSGPVYQRRWKREMGAELRDSVLIQRYLFGNHARVNHLVRGGSRMPWFTTAMIDYVAGRRSYNSLRRDVLLRSPGTAMRLFWKALRAA